MRFLAIGECMAELAPVGTEATYRLSFAGDTFNTAWYLARQRPDLDVAYLSAVGDDDLSDQMCKAIQDAGIATRHIARRSGQTVGLYLINLKDGERSFVYWRSQSAARHLAAEPHRLAVALDDADFIYFSGITLAILPDADRARLLAALGKARAAGKTIAFDPNLRPRLWATPASMTTAIMRGAAVSDIASPSFEDEATHFADATPDDTINRYVAAGCSTVIVKDGPRDVHLWQNGARDIVAVTPVTQVVDTTAAGDSFNAGVFAGLAAGQPLAQAVENACTLSAKVIGGKGALVPV